MAVRFSPYIWYAERAEEAARFYVSIIPGSSMDRVTALPVDSPGGPAGSVAIVEFTLAGAPVVAFSAGPHHAFNDAISLVLTCDTQEEIDHLWSGLQQGGGRAVQCGWLKDRYGVTWQIQPRRLSEMIAAGGPGAAAAARAMLEMVKLDIAGLEAAYAAA